MHSNTDLLREDYRRADRFMLFIAWGLFGMALALSGLHGTFWLALTVGGALAATTTLLVRFVPGSRLARHGNAVVMMAMAALHIHQGAGMVELHFGIFVLLAFLLCYRDYATILTGAVAIALHHVTFDWLQELGYGVRCFTAPGLEIVLIHAGYVVGETAVLCFLALRLRSDTLQAAELKASVARLCAQEGRVNLTAADAAALSPVGRMLQQSIATLHDTVAAAIAGVRHTRGASTTIAELNTALRGTTAEQGDLVRTVIASMAELTDHVQRNIDGTRQATDSAAQASAVASESGEAVAQVVDMMGRINESSDRILGIIGVIDHIAFQTNILALNAAVEAARAGEQGRGFAVVAAEVRQLAQRSAGAASEIKHLIEDTVRNVEHGNALVDRAGTTMRRVVASVAGMDGIIGQIAASSAQQAAATRAIGQEVERIGAITDRKAAMVASAAEAALEVERTSHALEAQMGQFDIAGQTGRPRARLA